MEITSLTNAKVKGWSKLKDKKGRDKEQQFLVEGEHLMEEAYKAGCLSHMIVLQGSHHPVYEGIAVYEVTMEIIRKLTSVASVETMLGVCRIIEQPWKEGGNIIILDGVQDPGNLGTIIRTAISSGFAGVLLSHDCVDVYNEKVVRSTQGALFHLPIRRVQLKDALPELKQQGMTLYATALQGSQDVRNVEIREPYGLVFGNEGNGIRNETLSLCNHRIMLPMEAFESLNVAVAAGICMYYFRYFR